MKGKVAPTKSTTKAYVSFCFSPSAVVLPAVYHFLYRQWNKRSYSTPFPKCFHFFREKNSLSKNFLVECVRSGAASCNKRREFWRETETPLWLLIGRIIFLPREKTSFAILIGRIIFARVKTIVRSSDWLELICVRKFTTWLFGEYFSVCL